jgi:uncharacterized protein HemX
MSKQKSLQKNDSSLGTAEPQKKITPKTALWFVLTVILIFACGGLVWYGQQIVDSINASFDQSNQKIEAVSQTLNANGEELASVAASQENMKEIFKTQNFNLEQLRNRDTEQRQTLIRLQTQINEVSTISSEGGDYWLTLQAGYFLNIAKTELSLFGNQASAKSALLSAQQSIQQLPEKYQIVAQSVQSALSKLDPEGSNTKKNQILISVQNIKHSVDSLVVNKIEMQQLAKEENEHQGARSAVENAWQQIVAAFKNLVVVRSNNDAQSLRLNATQKQITKTLISLQLEMIRFAVLQSDDDKYQASLNSCIELMESSFNIDTPSVRELFNQLVVLKNFELKQSVPEIDDALALLQETNAS